MTSYLDLARAVPARPRVLPLDEWDSESARAWLRVIVEDVGTLYAALPNDYQTMYRDIFEQFRGPLLAPIDRAFRAQEDPAFKAALAVFDAAATPIRAAAARQVEARTP